MKLVTLCLMLCALLVPATARAQIAIDTARGLVGKTISAPIRAPGLPAGRSGAVTVTATLRLSNPTVFYPQRITAPAGDVVDSFMLTALKDSIFEISFTVRRTAPNAGAGDTLAMLLGEALAGSDSVCIVTLESVRLNDAPIGGARGVVITESVGTPIPYVRFAILEQNYPNPVPRGRQTRWAYRIDKRSDITFRFFDLLGKEIHTEYLGVQDLGPHIYVYDPPPTLPTGTYYVRLETNSGASDKVMLILH